MANNMLVSTSANIWYFMLKVEEPAVGDILIQHRPQTGEAYHAAIIVNITDSCYNFLNFEQVFHKKETA